jgi:hypothetical protein
MKNVIRYYQKKVNKYFKKANVGFKFYRYVKNWITSYPNCITFPPFPIPTPLFPFSKRHRHGAFETARVPSASLRARCLPAGCGAPSSPFFIPRSLSPSLSAFIFPGGDDWASGDARGFAGPFARDERPPGTRAPSLPSSCCAKRSTPNPQTLTQIYLYSDLIQLHVYTFILPTGFDDFRKNYRGPALVTRYQKLRRAHIDFFFDWKWKLLWTCGVDWFRT